MWTRRSPSWRRHVLGELVVHLRLLLLLHLVDLDLEHHGDYLQMMGMTLDELRAQSKTAAERNVRSDLALEAVAAAEGIEVRAVGLLGLFGGLLGRALHQIQRLAHGQIGPR